MQKRIAQVSQAFQSCRFQDVLRQIQQIQKKIEKQSNKKKNNNQSLSQNDTLAINILKVGSLAATGKLHEAHHQLNQKFITCQGVSRDMSFLFLQICQLSMDQRSSKFTKQLSIKHAEQDVQIKRFEIGHRMFSKLAKQCLKSYNKSKKLQDAFGNTYMEYLNALHNINPNLINFSRDPIFSQQKGVNLKLPLMFFSRFLEDLKKQQLKQKLNQNQNQKVSRKLLCSVVDLQLKMCILQGNSVKAKQIYLQKINQKLITQPFRYLRSIREMNKDEVKQQGNNYNKQNVEFYIKQSLQRFKINLDFNQHIPIYDYYDQFLQFLRKYDNYKKIEQFPDQKLAEQQFYSYCFKYQSARQQTLNYYQSLHSQFLQLVSLQQKLGKHDYYKICIKGLLLQLIKMQSQISQKQNNLQRFLKQYRNRYGKTITYFMEIGKNGSKIQEQLTEQQKQKYFKKSEDRLIYLINCKKIYNKNIPQTIQELKKTWQEYTNLYEENKEKVENNRFLEKGERYLSDDFLIILSDIVSIFIQTRKLLEQQITSLQIAMVSLLQTASQKSQYNFQLKLRMMHFYNKLNYYDAIISTFETLDIKSVQYETMGFWILKTIIDHNLWHSQDSTLVKILRSYQENSRQSAQYSLKAMQRGSYSQVQQFLCYENNHNRSYTKLMMLFSLFLLHRRKDHSIFYLNKIMETFVKIQKQNKKLTLNCDFKTIQNRFLIDIPYIDFFGVYNNPMILKQQIRLRIYQKQLQSKRCQIEDINLNLTKWKLQDSYDFSKNFQIFQRKLQYKIHSLNQTQKEHELALQHYSILVLIKANIIDLVNSMYKNIKINVNENLEEKDKAFTLADKVEQIQKIFMKLSQNLIQKYTWRQQTKFITQTRIHFTDSIYLLKTTFEQLKKGKKDIKGIKKQYTVICERLIDEMMKIMTKVKFKQNLNKVNLDAEFQKLSSFDKCFERDQILQRVVNMNVKQVKQIYYIV